MTVCFFVFAGLERQTRRPGPSFIGANRWDVLTADETNSEPTFSLQRSGSTREWHLSSPGERWRSDMISYTWKLDDRSWDNQTWGQASETPPTCPIMHFTGSLHSSSCLINIQTQSSETNDTTQNITACVSLNISTSLKMDLKDHRHLFLNLSMIIRFCRVGISCEELVLVLVLVRSPCSACWTCNRPADEAGALTKRHSCFQCKRLRPYERFIACLLMELFIFH